MKQILFIIAISLGVSLGTFAQSSDMIEISGVVTDEKNEPLIGVSVFLKGSPTIGTVTDIDGKYKLKMEAFNRVVFSYIGFETQEILVKEQTLINVTLKESEAKSLDEVVVTGTGVQKKLTVTGAISTVNVEQLKSNPTTSIVNALAGNVPGMLTMQTSGQPGNNISEFWVRSVSTFGAGSSALVLVDGFEREFSQINVEDVESLTVLKDASETAIYGSRGANGVLLVQTKRGQEGKIKIEAKYETIYNTRTFTPEFVDGYTYAQMANEARVTRNQEPMFIGQELEILRLGLDPDLLPNVDWMDLLLKDGAWTNRATVTLNGGGANARYFVSGSYVSEEGMYKDDETLKQRYDTNANFSRYNYRMNADIDITKTTLFQVGMSGHLRKRNEPGAYGHDVWGSLMMYNPVTTPIKYSNGYIPAYWVQDPDNLDDLAFDDIVSNQMNPWTLATQTGHHEKWWNETTANVSLNQNLSFITEGLKFVGRFAMDATNESTIRKLKRPEMWKAERFRDKDGEIIYKRIGKPVEMRQQAWSDGERRETLEAELGYDRGFNGHNVSSTFKYSQDSKIETQNIGGDIKNSIPRRHQGIAGRIAYDWKHRYFINFNFGYNGSENFAKGHQFGFFPAISTAWNIAEEPILDSADWLEMFKIRYSYGKVGNDDTGTRFPFLYTISPTSEQYNWADLNFNKTYSSMRYTQPGSDYLTWEIAKKHNLGVDISLFKDKFSLTVDFFQEQRDGIFMRREHLPQTAVYDQHPYGNVGSVKAKGFDGIVKFQDKIGNVDFTVRGNMTYGRSIVLERDEEISVYPYQSQKGFRDGQTRGLIALGLFKDYDEIRNSPKQTFGDVQPGDVKYKDVNGDGIIDGGDRTAIGSTSRPNLIYGLGLSANWKGFNLNVHFQGAGKSSFHINGSTVRAFSDSRWGNVLTDMIGNYWISRDISGTEETENPNARYPRLTYGWNNNNYQESTMWLRDGSYLRLKTLDIGYTLPKSFITRYGIQNLRFFVIGSNLITWSNFKLWDPELVSSNGHVYPIAKSVTLGVSVNI